MKIVRTSALKSPPSRPIKTFEPPAAPLVRPMSPGAPKQADQLKPEEKHESGSIDPRQQVY
jgi:hypothetical protein